VRSLDLDECYTSPDDKSARLRGGDPVTRDAVRFLLRLAELELIDRERRMVERRIRAAHCLQIGDFILEAGGHVVNQPTDITAALAEAKKENHKAVLWRVKGSEGTHFVAIEPRRKPAGGRWGRRKTFRPYFCAYIDPADPHWLGSNLMAFVTE
jgi:hypothetical protein